MAEIILVPFGPHNFHAIVNLWCDGLNAAQIADQSGYSEIVIRMILKRALKVSPVGK